MNSVMQTDDIIPAPDDVLNFTVDSPCIVVHTDSDGIYQSIEGTSRITIKLGADNYSSGNLDGTKTMLWFASNASNKVQFGWTDASQDDYLISSVANIKVNAYDDGEMALDYLPVDTSKVCAADALMIHFQFTYFGAEYSQDLRIPVSIVKNGKQGIPGRNNVVFRQSIGYDSTFSYLSGTDSELFVDIVKIGTVWYLCVKSCSGINPVDDVTNNGGHFVVSSQRFIATEVALIENAVINFGQTNQLLVTDSSGNVVAGIKGQDAGGENDGINIFAGDYVPKDAPFRVSYKGEMWATNAHIDGEITSVKGSIGGFAISKQQLLASYQASGSSDVESMLLTYNLIRFTNNDVRVYIGDGESGISGGNVSSPIVVTNSRSTTDGLYCNNGFEADVYGCNASDDNSYTGNHAFIASHGDFCGFRKRTRRISANAHLDSFDSNIIVTSSNDVYITLSDGTYMEDGQEYFIMPATNLTYNKICIVENTTNPGSGTQHWFTNNTSNTPLKAIKCLYDKVNNKWHIFQIS